MTRKRATQAKERACAQEKSDSALAVLATLRRDRILEALASIAKDLLHSTDLHETLPNVAEQLGSATGVDRVHFFDIENNDGKTCTGSVYWHYVWSAPGIETPPDWQVPRKSMAEVGLGSWVPRLMRGEIIVEHARQMAPGARKLFESGNVKSAVCVPVFADGDWCGTIGFDNCRNERDWLPTELATIRTLAELVGAAVSRNRWQDKLADANRIIESSPTLLYRIGVEPPYPLIYLSENARQYGYDADRLLASPTRWQELIGRKYLPAIVAEIGALKSGKKEQAHVEFSFETPTGKPLWFEGCGYPRFDRGNRIVAVEGILTEVTERKRAVEELAALARTDALTGLANRPAFLDGLRLAVARAKRGAPPFAVHYLDLDHFKDVNDTLGHQVGDALLCAAADRLRDCVRETDIIARFGGDEFAVLQDDVTELISVERLAQKIIDTLAAPYVIDGNRMHTTVSIGIAVYSPEIDSPEAMLIKADLALYRAKGDGRNQFRFHSAEFDRDVSERVTVGEELRRAIELNEFQMYYQPQWELATGSIVGVEALIRWNHPTRGLLLPEYFIPVAETTGSILAIGKWVITEACRQVASWRDQGILPSIVSVNLSAAQFKLASGLDQVIAENLAEYSIPPERLELELTESLLLETTERHMEAFERVRETGVRLAIDDFGTGYSSLDYLRTFRVHRLKIDRGFVHHVTTSSDDAKIVRATISLAHELGIEVIAEGIETVQQRDFLISAGCRLGQGNLLGKAMPSDKMTALLARQARAAAT